MILFFLKDYQGYRFLELFADISNSRYENIKIFEKYLSQSEIDVQGFNSLFNIFSKAMDEAESYYDRSGGYEEFKAKYSALYFPEEGDDYSAYRQKSNA
jgi:hypothetical protein